MSNPQQADFSDETLISVAVALECPPEDERFLFLIHHLEVCHNPECPINAAYQHLRERAH